MSVTGETAKATLSLPQNVANKRSHKIKFIHRRENEGPQLGLCDESTVESHPSTFSTRKKSSYISPRTKRTASPIQTPAIRALSPSNLLLSPPKSEQFYHVATKTPSPLRTICDSKFSNTTLSPILNRSGLSIHTGNTNMSVGKKRFGLVRRTHSPKTVPSPLSTPVKASFLPCLKMGTKTYRLAELPFRCDGSVTKSKPDSCGTKKRKRTSSPMHNKRKGTTRSRSHSPISKRKASSPMRSSSLEPAKAKVEVRMLSPSVRGIFEAARILLAGFSSENEHGILSLPTETLYTLLCAIPFKFAKKGKVSTLFHKTKQMNTWEELCSLKSKYLHGKNNLHKDPPLLFLHTPTQAHYFVSITKPKTFILQKPGQGESLKEEPKDQNEKISSPPKQAQKNENLFTAVTFSENLEVMNRLFCAFWPGPAIIYAPVRTRKGAGSGESQIDDDAVLKSISPSSNHNVASVNEATMSKKEVVSTPTDKAMSERKTSPQGISNSIEGASSKDFTTNNHPVLPFSALVSSCDLFAESDNRKKSYFVGLRCPSHPLTRRVLAQFYARNKNSGKAKEGMPTYNNVRGQLRGAVIGFSGSILSQEKISSQCPLTSANVCNSLLSTCGVSSERNQNQDRPTTVHVLNGEDKREIFSVPTCQFGYESPIALVVDVSNRTVIIKRHQRLKIDHPEPDNCQKSTNPESQKFDIKVEDVIRALSKPKLDAMNMGIENNKSRVITAVLRRWKVVECNSS